MTHWRIRFCIAFLAFPCYGSGVGTDMHIAPCFVYQPAVDLRIGRRTKECTMIYFFDGEGEAMPEETPAEGEVPAAPETPAAE